LAARVFAGSVVFTFDDVNEKTKNSRAGKILYIIEMVIFRIKFGMANIGIKNTGTNFLRRNYRLKAKIIDEKDFVNCLFKKLPTKNGECLPE
jgi:hypothetical protein